MVDKAKISEERLAKAMALLEKEEIRQEKIKRGEIKVTPYKRRSEMTPEELAGVKALDKKYQVGIKIVMAKAKAAGLTATPAEVDEAVKTGKIKDYTKK